jgi:hypothetical protein
MWCSMIRVAHRGYGIALPRADVKPTSGEEDICIDY